MVKIISQNVRGINEKLKRRAIFNHFKSKADIICLQEVHSLQENNSLWSNEFGSQQCYWANYRSNSRGTAILITKKCSVIVNKVQIDTNGRYVIMQYTDGNELFVLVNLYALNEDDPTFCLELFKKLENLDGKQIFVGDFNLVLDPSKDCTVGNIRKNNSQSVEVILKYMEETMLCDIWRARHPEARVFTWSRKKPQFLGSRIDLMILPIAMVSWTNSIEIVPGFHSDHSAILCEILPFTIQRGRGL